MKLSTVTTIATVLLLWLLPVMGAHPRKLDPDELLVQDDKGNWIICPAPAPPSLTAPLVPFRFDSSLVNSPITQPAVIPTNVPIRIDHEIDIENDIQHAQQLSILDFYGTSSHNDRFPVASSSASSRSRRRVSDDGFDACNLPTNTLPVASSRSRRRVSDEFEACSFDPLCQSIPSPVASASSPDDPEWFDDDHELDDDELKCVDGLKVDDSVADIDSSQPVPTTEVSINVAATVHSTLH
jgi:hypothetical protein